MRWLRVIAALLAVSATSMRGQQSLFQTSDGQSSLYLQQSTAALNLGDSKASLGFTHHDNNKRSLLWGYELFATANKGVSSLFTSDKAKAPEGGGDVTLGSHFLATDDSMQSDADPDAREWTHAHPGQIYPAVRQAKAREDWALIDVGYSYATFYVSPTLVPASSAKTSLNKFRALGAYNYFYSGKFIVGVAAGVERRNNLSDLTSVQFQTVVAVPPPGGSNSVVKIQTGYYGNYKQYVAAPIYTDFLLYLGKLRTPGFGNRIAVDFLSRSDVATANRSALGGLGLFFFKKGNATVPLGGITGSYDGSKFQVSLTTGLTVSK